MDAERVWWLKKLITCYAEEHDFEADEDPEGTLAMIQECSAAHDELLAMYGPWEQGEDPFLQEARCRNTNTTPGETGATSAAREARPGTIDAARAGSIDCEIYGPSAEDEITF